MYFDYFLFRALEESGINSNGRRYQSFKAKLNKSQELELLTQLQYEFLDEINKLRNRFVHNVFFDVTSWDPTTLPLVRNYSLVITLRGKGVAVVLDVAEYEAMQEKIELLEEVQQAEAQIASGFGLSNEDARSKILRRLRS
ncbi:hypothetical protein VSAL_I1467 [Aliivibrio salmonicida LFI1238]|uniref:Antitoxin n=1 Tax=Aliivibrio salmonicida (strain LFI1238) TaxID=316275 RepID=B6EL53_ALISL|nr:hypothetical protein VSAL_I1467 [Aliivibrio salmonicida LFI1238]